MAPDKLAKLTLIDPKRAKRLISNSRFVGAHRPGEFLFNRQNPFQQPSSSLESAERVAQLGFRLQSPSTVRENSPLSVGCWL